jgi:UDP-3-O-[3-hydroxymyristoyl] glucosamine N-acyltransferase
MIDPRFYTHLGPLSLAQLIEGIDVSLDPHFYDEMISFPASMKLAKAGDITFFQDKRRKLDLENCQATACLVTERLAPLVSDKHILPIISQTPRAHFARICDKLVSQRPSTRDTSIHSDAIVHPTAIIGDGVIIETGAVIGAYSVLGNGVKIGANSVVEPHVSLSFCEIGSDCRIKSGAVIGGAGFGVAKDEKGLIDLPHIGRVIIGNRVSIGSQTCIDRGQLGDTILSNDVKIDNLVQIGHNVNVGEGTMMAGHVGISGSCDIGKNVQIGGNVGLSDHVTIGDNVMIAAKSGVMHNIPAGEAWSGYPAMPIREHMRVVSATRKLAQKPKRDELKRDKNEP